jgi:tRNA pseudouridine synthase 10
LLTRKKTVYSARAEYINPHWFLLDVLTSAGAYVKEFVHGDRGRTVPSVGSIIGARATIIQLDVIGVRNNKHGAQREGSL